MRFTKNFLFTFLILLTLVFQFFHPSPVSAACSGIVYVDKDSTAGSPTGCSWALAFPTLQDALTLGSLASGDEIWVAEGTYYPDEGAGQTNNARTSTFQLVNGVSVYGGFNGTETVRTDRNPAVNVTILSGDIDGVAGNANNAYHVVVAFNVSSGTILDGFTIRDGNDNSGTGIGGGMYLSDSSPTLANLVITNNSVTSNGGGVFVTTVNNLLPEASYSRPSFTDVTFSNNTAGRGGGLFAQNASPILTRVVFSGNVANNGAGGGMNSQVYNAATDARSIPRLTDVTFSNNTATGGGGLFNTYSDSILNNVTFSGNTATRRGGGMLNEFANPTLTNVTFNGNTSNNVGADPRGGGGILNIASNPVLNNVTFSGNISTANGITGGAIRNVIDPAGLVLTSNPVIRNSIFWGDSSEIVSDGTGTTTISDSVVQGGFAGGTNIITTNPNLSALSNNGGFTQTMAISAGSSALDTGGVTTACAATDQRGVTRPQGIACDIGAFEAGGTATSTTVANANATYGDVSVDLSATVFPNPGGGTVQFYVDGNPVGAPVSVNAGTGIATLTYNPSALNVGNYTVRAEFSGFGSFLSSTSNPANNGTLTIAMRAITVTADSGQSKVYGDVDPVFTYQITSGSLAGSDTLTGALSRAAGETVGNYAITQGTLSANANYALTFVSADFNIIARDASVTPNDAGKAYGDPDPIPLTNGTLTGFLPADGVTATYTRTAGEGVGNYTISATLSPAGVLGNYNITYNTATFTITGLAVTPNITANDKIYDGTTAATFTCTLSGVIGMDDVTCTGGTADFSDKHVGVNKLVTATGLVLSGTDSGNYTLATTTDTDNADITSLAITVTAATDTKTYDGTTASIGIPSITTGALATGDTANWTQTFDTKHVGTGKTLTPAGTVNDGNGGNNYDVTFIDNTTGEIIQRAITVTAVTDTKPYDGTVTSTGVPTITSGSLAPGDTAVWTQTFDTPLVGVGKTLTPAGTVTDGNGGNNYDVTFAQDFTGVITGTPIDVTINQAGSQTDPTNASPINFTVTFSALVNDFVSGDVTLSGTAGATTAVVTGSGTTYNIAVSGMSGDGTVIASIPAGVASDSAGNLNLASTSADNTVTYDTTGPTVAINQAGAQPDPTNASPINFTVAFNEDVNGFSASDVTLSGTAGATTAVVTGGPAIYNVAVSGMTGEGTVIATINGGVVTDDAGNGNVASTSTDNTVTYDTTGPIVTIGTPVPAATVTGPVDFAVTIAGATTVNLTPADVTLNTTGSAAATTVTITNGNTANPTVTVSGVTGSGTIGISIAAGIATDAGGNISLAAGPSAPFLVDNAGPVVLFDANTVPADGATVSGGPSQLRVAFNEDVKNDGSAGAVNNLVNYLLIQNGANRTLDTVSCALGVQGDDVQIAIDAATYTNNGGGGPFVATLDINGGTPLPVGSYHLFVCGTTSIEDLTGNELNDGAADTIIDFRVVQATASVPKTGFAMGTVTDIPTQPAGLTYSSTDMWIEIPTLGVKIAVLGVPKTSAGWDVTWLNRNAGWLNGSAFPTWKGNSVITAHVWDALNKPGPFARLKELKYGDQVKIHAFGQVYIYEVRETTTITPTDTSAMLKPQEKSWLTLITCEGFQEVTKDYSSRRMVRAVLVSVTTEK